MNTNKKILFHLIGKEGIPYDCNFIPAEQGWHELPNYIDDLVDSAKGQAAFLIEAYIDDVFIENMDYLKKHKIKLEDLNLYLNAAFILAEKDFFIIFISDLLDDLVFPVHVNKSSERISEWEISCGGWPESKDELLSFYFPELPHN